MRNLAPSVTKQDLENLCKNYEGFKRIALSDPGPERDFFRRGWITFESHVDVKKICWSLQNTKIRDFNPGAIVNRELTNRIRPIPNLVSHHKSVIKNDIKLAMKIVQSMDKRWNLWQDKVLNESVDMEPVEEVKPEPEDAAEKETANLEREAFCKLEKQGPNCKKIIVVWPLIKISEKKKTNNTFLSFFDEISWLKSFFNFKELFSSFYKGDINPEQYFKFHKLLENENETNLELMRVYKVENENNKAKEIPDYKIDNMLKTIHNETKQIKGLLFTEYFEYQHISQTFT